MKPPALPMDCRGERHAPRLTRPPNTPPLHAPNTPPLHAPTRPQHRRKRARRARDLWGAGGARARVLSCGGLRTLTTAIETGLRAWGTARW
eukprot:6460230-Prymnesium_polylepis.2